MIDTIISGLFGLVRTLKEMGKDKRDLRDNALRAISHALNETYLYYRDLDKGKKRNLDTEAQLSRYWSAAAIPLRYIDENLASICDHKSDYWINPESWDQEKIQRFKIDLKEVREQYRHLLYPGLFPLKRRNSSWGEKEVG
jgi:hypothetical protein